MTFRYTRCHGAGYLGQRHLLEQCPKLKHVLKQKIKVPDKFLGDDAGSTPIIGDLDVQEYRIATEGRSDRRHAEDAEEKSRQE